MRLTLRGLQQIPNAVQPTGGQGFVLPIDGTQPLMLAAQGARKIAYGSGTLHFTASTQSDLPGTVVTHNLGVTPVTVLACIASIYGTVSISTTTSTTATVLGFSDQGAMTGNVTFYWAAIG